MSSEEAGRVVAALDMSGDGLVSVDAWRKYCAGELVPCATGAHSPVGSGLISTQRVVVGALAGALDATVNATVNVADTAYEAAVDASKAATDASKAAAYAMCSSLPSGLSSQFGSGSGTSASGAALAGGEVRTADSLRIQNRWRAAKRTANVSVATKRWHSGVDTLAERLCLACTRSHTLCTGIIYRGSAGYTRAQTCMVLINGFVFEANMCCLMYTPPAPGPYRFNVVGVIFTGTVASLITVFAMVSIVWLFHPMSFVRMAKWLARALVMWPYYLALCWTNRSQARVAPMPSAASIEQSESVPRPASRGFGAAPASSAAKEDSDSEAKGYAVTSKGELRTYSYESLNSMMLKASLSQSCKRGDMKSVRLILLGWTLQYTLYLGMLFNFLLYGCELLEPTDTLDPSDPVAVGRAGRQEEFMLSWALSAFQRFVLHEPTIILASKALPVLFASAFCTNCVGETIVNMLTVFFSMMVSCLAQIKG